MNTLTLWGVPATRRAPFAEFDALVRRAFGPVEPRRPGFVPAAEVTRDGEDAVVALELPGLDIAKDVAVELDGGRLIVRGERRDERTDEGDGLREVRYGSFRRSFALPRHIGAEAVTASYDAGVLTVRVAGAHTGHDAQQIAISAAAPAAEEGEPEQPAA